MLKHAVSNLIQNAIKYNTENGKAHIKTKKANNQLLIIVSDTGIGISPDALRIFLNLSTVKQAND